MYSEKIYVYLCDFRLILPDCITNINDNKAKHKKGVGMSESNSKLTCLGEEASQVREGR